LMSLLRENRFDIDARYWRGFLFVTMMSLINSKAAKKEERLHGADFATTKIESPLFILGHWRSGTTFLHNLITLDRQFAFPNLFQVTHPHTFIHRESMVVKALADESGEKRSMDNMTVTFDSPGEDEFALLVLCLRSPLVGWIFPRREEFYDRYLTFRTAPSCDLDRWKSAMIHFMKKLTWRYQRPLALKSPVHTARIKILLDLFPEARFIHIHRNPYVVFRSTQKLYQTTVSQTCFQRPCSDPTDGILRRYQQMYDVFFEERSLIPSGHYWEIGYEELEKDIEGELRKAYEALEIPGFDALLPTLRNYISSIKGYQKNVHDQIKEPLRSRVAEVWQRSFGEWGYPI
jgi:hypothetical protein